MIKLVFVLNDAKYFPSHRMPIGVTAIQRGWEVHLIAPNSCPEEVKDNGIIFHQIPMSRSGSNPLGELKTLFSIYTLFKELQPDIVHLVTIKSYLYGGIASRLAKVPCVVSAVAGLGILFSQESWKSRMLRLFLKPFYKSAFNHQNQVSIFQNSNDRDLLINWEILDPKKVKLVRGAGADLSLYPFLAEAQGIPVISFAARLLKDKGVVEFVESARILKARGIQARFWLIGDLDPGNGNTVTQAQLDEWQQAGDVECLGYRKDIAHLFAQSNIVTLPSFYGEGLPKVLIEAAACGRAVVTTDHPGCRDAIEPDLTGVLVPVRDAEALANAIQDLIENPDKRKAMAKAGRELSEKVFAIEKVVDAHLAIYDELLGKVSQ